MINYDKVQIKNQLRVEDIYDLLSEWGGEPEYAPFGILSSTICHNEPGRGSRKLYFYTVNGMFKCYTGCEQSVFDIFDLTMRVFAIQKKSQITLNDAVRWIAAYFNLSGEQIEIESFNNEDWEKFEFYNKINEIEEPDYSFEPLPEYDKEILKRLNYNVKIQPWLDDGISQEVLQSAHIGYYPGGEQITIPHYDINNRFVGLRGRALIKSEAEMFGKYRPIKINNILYNHPLGRNLYNLNSSKDNIAAIGKAIVVEGEKSSLLYRTMFGTENDITVATCGSALSKYQMQLLINLGVKEVIIAFDREGSLEEKKKYVQKFYNIKEKFGNDVIISFIYDKKGEYLDFKDSPLDKGKEVFLKLYKKRIFL